ncbi:hypothetical protein KIL84_003674 [Mauremys mutica]|uniref:Uncharacterized protein n=1 Tax=Mauremys mutica TaxID=74926 RepID=A0A9D3WW32_9SAUR|nr:hypothetical protein KIL84_003674 [Mauremys mutica]
MEAAGVTRPAAPRRPTQRGKASPAQRAPDPSPRHPASAGPARCSAETAGRALGLSASPRPGAALATGRLCPAGAKRSRGAGPAPERGPGYTLCDVNCLLPGQRPCISAARMRPLRYRMQPEPPGAGTLTVYNGSPEEPLQAAGARLESGARAVTRHHAAAARSAR